MMTAPLRDRFGRPIPLDYYDLSALEQIVRRSAGVLSAAIERKAFREIARRLGYATRCQPLLRRVRDFADVLHARR
jgi:Holliday junction DNA helicase RuvB